MNALPIDPILPELCRVLVRDGRAVLVAPPGAGKTTRVPLALLDRIDGRIVMLEPRRIAARAAAERMAETLGEAVGQRVGYRIRGEAKVSKATRIEVVTEGILTRMLQSDPALEGIGAVIFDEFHERSLAADLGLALAWESRGVLREDLKILVMSATLDAEPVAALLDDAPIVTSEGRSFPVETRWRERPLGKRERLEAAVAETVLQALRESSGGVLVFLPGEGEIRRTAAALKGKLPGDVALHTLFGAMDPKAQRAAIRPAKQGRKIVLATSIAETSLTIEDVRVVIDAGKARRARTDPGSGMSRLVTERVSKAEAEQRRGRAGRVAEGVCYRLWTKGEEGGMAPFPPAEIEVADLAPLALELAVWGAGDGADLAFLTPPNPGVLAEARRLLQGLGALEEAGRITAHGRAMARLPVHPRIAHMLLIAEREAAEVAALLEARDPLPRGMGTRFDLRLAALRDPKKFEREQGVSLSRAALEPIRQEAKRLRRLAPDGTTPDYSAAQMAALAYPDRVGLRRPGDAPRYVLSGGRGAELDAEDALAGQRLIVLLDSDGGKREARARLVVPISEAELRAVHGAAISWVARCEWSRRERRVLARRQERFGAVVLADQTWKDAPEEAVARAMLDGVRELGLRPSPAAARFLARARLAQAEGMPDMSEAALMAELEDWLLPHLGGVRSAADWKKFDLTDALRARLDWGQMQRLDKIAPPHFTTPMGRKVPVDYAGEAPEIAVRLQEMFGVTQHPMIGNTPLRITLLSPAGRPVQTTADLPAFWQNSYADVRKDMRGQYPKHPWPEDPAQADPTLRAKPRKR
ncbi:MAG: ATP-dependent helicase HrpB [Rhodobacterales bacterium]|nr:MAG: ATP-dependent helicase HrpB [Rhodobacterales bacterium]